MITNNNDYYEESFAGLDYANNKFIAITFDNCVFSRCDFSASEFRTCKFRDCSFKNCNLSLTNFPSSQFLNVHFEECKIIGVNWAYCAWSLIKLTFPLIFKSCNISQSSFMELNLHDAQIVDSIVRDVDFRGCNLQNATLTGNDFQNSLFVKTDLTKANFRNSINYSISLVDNNVTKAKFSMPEAMSLLYSLNIEIE